MRKFRERIIAYLPELLVLLLCGGILLWECSLKEGYHMDELLSFELANAEFNPWIVPTQPQGRLAKFVENEIRGDSPLESLSNLVGTAEDVLKNRGGSTLLSYRADVYEEPVWIDRQTFQEYITVDEKDDFNYLSVYFNVKDDNHPPLHFMVLHTVSSVFKNKISPMMGCVINLAFVLGTMVLLLYMGREVMAILGYPSAGRMAGIFAALLYGLSGGALATTLLIRMYAMLAFWCAAFLAVHIRKLYGGSFQEKNKWLVLVTLFGFWTQYFFLFYCLILAAVTAVLLWMGKRRRELWCYVRTMTAAAVIGVAVFPFSVSDVFASSRGVEAMGNLGRGFSGYGTRLAAFSGILVRRMGAGCLIALAAAVFLAVYVIVLRGKFDPREKVSEREKDSSLWAVLWVPVIGYFLLAARMSPYLVDRYIMPLFALAVFDVVILLFYFAAAAEKVGADSISDGAEKAGAVFVSDGAEKTGADSVSDGVEKTGADSVSDGTEKVGAGFVSDGAVAAKRRKFRTAVAGAALAALVFGQFLTPWRQDVSYFYTGYREQEALAGRYRDYPCICVYEGGGYYENLVEFTCYDRTLLVTSAELENREDRASISELDRVVVLIKQAEDEARITGILQEKYGLELEERLSPDTAYYASDRLLLFKHS